MTGRSTQEGRRRTCELQDPVEAGSVFRAGLSQAGGPLQVGLHLVLNLQLAHAPASLQVVEVNQLVWLGLRLGVLQADNPIKSSGPWVPCRAAVCELVFVTTQQPMC